MIPDPQQVNTILQNIPDPSETATIQNASELSNTTTNNPQGITITNDSNILQILVHNMTQNPKNDQTPIDAIQNKNQDNTSTFSTSNTLITPEFQTQKTLKRNYDPLLLLHNVLLKLLHIFLLNRDLLIPKPQIQYNFKQQLQQHNQKN